MNSSCLCFLKYSRRSMWRWRGRARTIRVQNRVSINFRSLCREYRGLLSGSVGYPGWSFQPGRCRWYGDLEIIPRVVSRCWGAIIWRLIRLILSLLVANIFTVTSMLVLCADRCLNFCFDYWGRSWNSYRRCYLWRSSSLPMLARFYRHGDGYSHGVCRLCIVSYFGVLLWCIECRPYCYRFHWLGARDILEFNSGVPNEIGVCFTVGCMQAL